MRLAGMDNLSPECNMQHPWHLQKGGPDIVSLPYLQVKSKCKTLDIGPKPSPTTIQ